MRALAPAIGKGFFHSIIVTRADGSLERYDPVNGDMMDMDACKALAACRAEMILESPHLSEVFYGRAG